MDNRKVKTLFGDEVGEYKTGKHRRTDWPVTVWDCNLADPQVRRVKRQIGDPKFSKDSARPACLQPRNQEFSKAVYKNTQSVFNPATAYWLLNMYAPKKGICFDPFGGGGTRAIMSARHGMEYIGVEVRKPECEAIKRRARANNLHKSIKIINQDARDCSDIKSNIADFCITCPPYYNVEHYSGGDDDLSMFATYDEFNKGMLRIIKNSYRILKPGAISCWIVGLIRDQNSELQCMNHDTARMHKKVGFKFMEEIVLAFRGIPALQRVGMFEKGHGFLVRIHEYALIFQR